MASTTTVNSNAGIARSASGLITASATATSVFIELGFVPKYVRVQGLVNLIVHEWFEGMNGGDFFETTDASGIKTLETDDKLIVGAVGAVRGAAAPAEGEVLVVTAGGVLDDNDGAVWFAVG